jgi:quercetin dioxygenase-like cupin family protein
MDSQISLPGQGVTFHLEDQSWARFKLTGSMTGGAFEAFERFVPPHTLGADPHYHNGITETIYVISGLATIQSGDSIQVYEAGSMLLIPPKVVHGFWNKSDAPIKMLLTFLPAWNHDEFFAELSRLKQGPVESYEEELAALRERFDSVSA